jgi:hypothetical protein
VVGVILIVVVVVVVVVVGGIVIVVVVVVGVQVVDVIVVVVVVVLEIKQEQADEMLDEALVHWRATSELVGPYPGDTMYELQKAELAAGA